MAYKTCDWCGRTYKPMFSADRDVGNAFMNGLGLGIVTKAVGGAARLAGKRNFCSKQCKLAYEQSKTGGNAVSAESNESNNGTAKSGGFMSGYFDTLMQPVTKNQAAQDRAKTDEIVNLQFETTSEGLQAQLQNLFTQISALPKFKTLEQKSLYNAIKEKVEFGIMKLNSLGVNAEADFFQKKFDKLK